MIGDGGALVDAAEARAAVENPSSGGSGAGGDGVGGNGGDGGGGGVKGGRWGRGKTSRSPSPLMPVKVIYRRPAKVSCKYDAWYCFLLVFFAILGVGVDNAC